MILGIKLELQLILHGIAGLLYSPALPLIWIGFKVNWNLECAISSRRNT